MPRVSLLPIDRAVRATIAQGDEAFVARHGARLGSVATLAAEVCDQTLAMIEASPRVEPWGGYLGVDREQGLVVGTCAFKAAPTDDGSVEIAYFTFPEFEGRGIATAMAASLIELALGAGARCVLAHTQPHASASTAVLDKLAFAREGEAIDPQDGPVWRWSRVLSVEAASEEAAGASDAIVIPGSAPSRSVSLLAVDADVATAFEAGIEAAAARLELTIDSEAAWVNEVVAELAGALADHPREAPWISYLGVDDDSRRVVGSCGFRDEPDDDGVVEILHVLTIPGLEGRGFGTAMARALLRLAAEDPSVRRVVAYSLPETSPLTSLLTRAGMRFRGLVTLPGEEPLWGWEWGKK